MRYKEFDIRRGSIDDLENIAFLNCEIFKGMYSSAPYSLEYYRRRLIDEAPFICLVKNDKKLIANSIAFEKNNSFYLWILAVDKKYRKQGIASKLLQMNEEMAKEKGLKVVSTKVYKISKEMIQLLTKRGYTERGDISSNNLDKNKFYFFELNND